MEIKFKNPIGLAAGFDKNAVLTGIIPVIGFGFMEVGSITAEKCLGNPRPRLFRLPKDNSLVVNYGLCNDGAIAIHKRLKGKRFRIPIGISIARTNKALNEQESIDDYTKGFKIMQDIGSYITINISCPNTLDKKNFCDPLRLDKLLKELKKYKHNKPILLKIKPDLTEKDIDKLLSIVSKYKFINGFIISNLSSKRNLLNLKTEKHIVNKTTGGISGFPVKKRSTYLIRYVYKKTKGKYIIIGCGGVFTAEDAYEKIKAGANLIQLVTGMIYNGPGLIKKINKGLVKLLEKDGFNNIQQAVGRD